MASQPDGYQTITIYIAQISLELKVIRQWKLYITCGGKPIPEPFLKNQNWVYL